VSLVIQISTILEATVSRKNMRQGFEVKYPNCKTENHTASIDSLMFIAASSVARYLNTYGIATRLM